MSYLIEGYVRLFETVKNRHRHTWVSWQGFPWYQSCSCGKFRDRDKLIEFVPTKRPLKPVFDTEGRHVGYA